jgi:hypothetical protein
MSDTPLVTVPLDVLNSLGFVLGYIATHERRDFEEYEGDPAQHVYTHAQRVDRFFREFSGGIFSVRTWEARRPNDE